MAVTLAHLMDLPSRFRSLFPVVAGQEACLLVAKLHAIHIVCLVAAKAACHPRSLRPLQSVTQPTSLAS